MSYPVKHRGLRPTERRVAVGAPRQRFDSRSPSESLDSSRSTLRRESQTRTAASSSTVTTFESIQDYVGSTPRLHGRLINWQGCGGIGWRVSEIAVVSANSHFLCTVNCSRLIRASSTLRRSSCGRSLWTFPGCAHQASSTDLVVLDTGRVRPEAPWKTRRKRLFAGPLSMRPARFELAASASAGQRSIP